MDREHLESPESLRSKASLRASLTVFATVLASAVFPERLPPFSPTHVGRPNSRSWVGLKGAGGSANPDDASTAGTSGASDEERSESREPRRRGLSRWFQFHRLI
ncbi:hypothetical protein EWF95_03145 [Halonotius roseus]|uniref:Uncharacterized protein n=1 Tax=Halonotius roseus TaxID=2511997 RepID=A0A544QR94_9EURY|nr:hypothetical protein EWF95_03145 [Halonotius roseus]